MCATRKVPANKNSAPAQQVTEGSYTRLNFMAKLITITNIAMPKIINFLYNSG
jgi:hypothetical protein